MYGTALHGCNRLGTCLGSWDSLGALVRRWRTVLASFQRGPLARARCPSAGALPAQPAWGGGLAGARGAGVQAAGLRGGALLRIASYGLLWFHGWGQECASCFGVQCSVVCCPVGPAG